MKDGVRVLNVARGPLIVDEDLAGGARLRQGRPAPRSTSSAASRSPSTRCSAYPSVDRHAAPRRLDRRGDRPRRLPGRRAGRRRADRRQRHDRGQRPGHRRRGPRGPRPVPAAVPATRHARRGARRGRLDRPHRGRVPRAASPSATRRPLDDRGAARGALPATPRRTSTTSTPRRSPPSAGSTSAETKPPNARDFTDLVRVTVVSGERRDARRRHDPRPSPPSAPARGVGAALQRPARGPSGAVPLPRPAGHDRPRRHGARRRRHQHRLLRRWATSPTTAKATSTATARP